MGEPIVPLQRDHEHSADCDCVFCLKWQGQILEQRAAEDSWRCQCGNRNPDTWKSCAICYRKRPELQDGKGETG